MAVKNLASSGVLFTDRRKFDLDRAKIHQLASDVAPFTKWLDSLAMDTVTDPDFKMFEDDSDYLQEKLSINDASPSSWSNSGTPTNSTVTATVDNPVNVSVDDSLVGVMVEIYDSTDSTLKGMALVDSVTNSTTIVLSALGNPTASDQAMTDLEDNDTLYINGHAWGEGKTAPDAFQNELSVVWNSTGISRTPLELTNTLVETAIRNGGESSEIQRIRDRKQREHLIRLEKKYLTSWRVGGIGGTAHSAGGGDDSTFVNHTSDANSNVVRTTAGYIPILLRYGRTSGDKQNVFTFSKGSKDFADTVEVFEKISQYGSSIERQAFCGPGAISYFNLMSDSERQNFNIEISPMEMNQEGFPISRLVTSWGVLNLTPLKSLYGTPYHNWILIPHKDHIRRVQFRPDRFFGNIKTDDNYDGVKDEYFSDDGIKLAVADGHALIKLQ